MNQKLRGIPLVVHYIATLQVQSKKMNTEALKSFLPATASTRELDDDVQDGVISVGKLTLTLEWQDRGRRSAVSGIRLIAPVCIYK